jgi:hypothetical protein
LAFDRYERKKKNTAAIAVIAATINLYGVRLLPFLALDRDNMGRKEVVRRVRLRNIAKTIK